jgi:predicted  nucleic acid-binding Zn-ribbon protein
MTRLKDDKEFEIMQKEINSLKRDIRILNNNNKKLIKDQRLLSHDIRNLEILYGKLEKFVNIINGSVNRLLGIFRK